MSANESAFLAMISASEGTDKAPDPYAVCYGYSHTIVSFADHPAATGEWEGESLDSLGPQYWGEKSTAAGKYQINLPTWKLCQRALGLRDFTPASQDAAALYLIRQDGALDMVNGGQVADAIGKCRETWASLPGNSAGQPQSTLANLIQSYTTAGGAFA